jgi:hypothetical protein
MWVPIMLAAFEQLADALARRGRVVADQEQARLFLSHQFVEQPLRRADAHESTDHDACAVRDHGNGLFGGNGLHDRAPASIGDGTIDEKCCRWAGWRP